MIHESDEPETIEPEQESLLSLEGAIAVLSPEARRYRKIQIKDNIQRFTDSVFFLNKIQERLNKEIPKDFLSEYWRIHDRLHELKVINNNLFRLLVPEIKKEENETNDRG